jgi:hypothetical protein
MIRLLAGTVALVAARGCGDNHTLAQAELTDEQLAMLDKLADVIIPPDDTPGGAQLGTRAYVAQLVAAFDVTGAPAIYCDGPFSDRNPFPDLATGLPTQSFPDSDFARFAELDRVTFESWQLFVLGGDGPNGTIVGLRDQLVAGLNAAIATASSPAGSLTAKQAQFVFDALPADFQSLLIDLVTEAAFSAPEYGGNPELAGWQLVHFEGDSLPLGYSVFNGLVYVERPQHPLSTANPGADPDPITSDVDSLLKTVVSVLGGRLG